MTPLEALLMIVYATLVGAFVLVIANGSAFRQYERMRKGQIAWYRSTSQRKSKPRGRYVALPTHHEPIPDHPKRGMINGDYSAELERYAEWYGVDPNDEDAKRNFLSDLDEDEDQDRRG